MAFLSLSHLAQSYARQSYHSDPDRQRLWNNVKSRLLKERDVCRYCRQRFKPHQRRATLDHIMPRLRGGDDSEGNLTLCCRQCNREKGTFTLAEWRDHLRRQLASVEAMLEKRQSGVMP